MNHGTRVGVPFGLNLVHGILVSVFELDNSGEHGPRVLKHNRMSMKLLMLSKL